MINIIGNEIRRDNEIIGYIDGNYIRNHKNERVGYFEENYVRDANTNKLGYIDGEYFYSQTSRSSFVELDKINAGISGGVIPEIGKCAIYELLGGDIKD